MLKKLFACAISLFLFTGSVFALNLPLPKGFVNDYAGILKPQETAFLEARLMEFEKETSNEIVVAIIPDLQATTVEDFAEKLFQAWKIGKEKKDNGILFLVSVGERKARLEVGYGLEGAVPDGKIGRILDNEVIPFFKTNDFYQGIEQGINALIDAVKGEYAQASEDKQTSSQSNLGNALSYLVFLFIFLLSYLGSFLGRSKAVWPGGVIGLILGGLVGFFLAGLIYAIAGGVMLGIFGLIFDTVVSRNYQERKKRGLPTDFWHSGGGFWLGGGRGGGSGFGGFGGGFSGGGGASRGF